MELTSIFNVDDLLRVFSWTEFKRNPVMNPGDLVIFDLISARLYFVVVPNLRKCGGIIAIHNFVHCSSRKNYNCYEQAMLALKAISLLMFVASANGCVRAPRNMRMNGGSSSSGGGGASGGGSSSASAGGSSAAAGSRSYSLMGSVPGGGSLSEMGSTPSGTGTVDIGGGSYMIGGGTDIMVSPIMVTTFIRGMDNDRDRGRGRGRGRGRDHEDNGNHFGQM
ncbi:hypothetical protein Y032_0198g1637 [Ancylostoma ceylanicum]|uniref:Uncharacterized protein n=1 Tax=Ancylostoma ceylanicum TaxID=53326 RepID=A0A016SP06_9BILA|nr:hypothetical protein Y032_0198g1637 [Ancylostoma ceylanicum]